MTSHPTAARIRGPAPPRQVVTLRLPSDVHTQLRALSVFMDTTVNDLVQGLIEDYLAAEGRQRLKEELDGLLPGPVEQAAERQEKGE